MNKIELKNFLNFNYLSGLKTNKDKNIVTFVKSTANYEKDLYEYKLYMKQNENVSRIHTFTSSPQYYWFNNHQLLINTTQKELADKKKTSFSKYYINNGEIEPFITLSIPVSNIEVIDEDTLFISALLNKEDFILLDEEKRDTYIQSLNDNKNFETFEEIPFYMNGGGFVKGKRTHTFIYTISTDTYKQITPLGINSTILKYDIDNKALYFSQSPDEGVPSFYDSLYKYNLDTDEYTPLLSDLTHSISRVIILNDEVYVMANDLLEYGINQNNDFYKVKNNKLELICKFGLSSNNSIGSDVRLGSNPSSATIDNVYYFLGTYHNRTRIYSFNGSKVDVVFDLKGSVDGWIDTIDGINGVGLFDNKLQEIYKLDFESNTVNQITKFNTKQLENKYVAEPQHISYENDGVLLDGWVLLPEGYNQANKYPAILDIHGGPKTIYSDVYYHEMQVWANLGYIVFFTNPRGGDAYDDSFADIRGKYGSVDYNDIMKFTDIVIESYSVDTDRIGVTGGSYGGFMTNWIVSHTHRFKAATTQRSISNWISFYGTSDIGVYFAEDQTASNPYDSLEAMWEQSPLKHAQNIKTPLLFIHSDEDYRCPMEQAMQLFTVVKKNGVDTRFVWFKGENHDLSRSGRPQSRVKRLEEITNWFNTKL